MCVCADLPKSEHAYVPISPKVNTHSSPKVNIHYSQKSTLCPKRQPSHACRPKRERWWWWRRRGDGGGGGKEEEGRRKGRGGGGKEEGGGEEEGRRKGRGFLDEGGVAVHVQRTRVQLYRPSTMMSVLQYNYVSTPVQSRPYSSTSASVLFVCTSAVRLQYPL